MSGCAGSAPGRRAPRQSACAQYPPAELVHWATELPPRCHPLPAAARLQPHHRRCRLQHCLLRRRRRRQPARLLVQLWIWRAARCPRCWWPAATPARFSGAPRRAQVRGAACVRSSNAARWASLGSVCCPVPCAQRTAGGPRAASALCLAQHERRERYAGAREVPGRPRWQCRPVVRSLPSCYVVSAFMFLGPAHTSPRRLRRASRQAGGTASGRVATRRVCSDAARGGAPVQRAWR